MSTRSTIKYVEGQWHLYEEMFDPYPDNISLQTTRRDFDGTPIFDVTRIPWEAAVALHTYVTKRLQDEANLRDPEWLRQRITELEAELEAESNEEERGLADFFYSNTLSAIETYKLRLQRLEDKNE